MELISKTLRLSPTDLSNHLACKHLTQLNRAVAVGSRAKPSFSNPGLAALAERGLVHEKAYVNHLLSQKKNVVELPENTTIQDVIALMKKGVDVIVQATLSDNNWRGRADLLIKVDRPCPNFGTWSYEVYDTKLAVDTKAGTILQLSVYCDILSQIQGVSPEYMHVIKPGHPFEEEKFRYDDFKAYSTLVKKSLADAVTSEVKTYPEPVEQCHVCRWWQDCDTLRRNDDHLSFVAGIRKLHIEELNKHNTCRLEEFAKLEKPLPEKPEQGHIDSYHRIHEQARIQFKGKGLAKPIYNLILPFVDKKGFYQLPEPSDGDVYFDFEGDPFYPDGGIEYLFGMVFKDNNENKYHSFWAMDRSQEKKAFDEFMKFIMERWDKYPDMHIYHYSPYEPSAIKRLMSRHALHEETVDKILRGQRFVDLYSISKNILRASVETYSIKHLEKLADFVRKCDLKIAGPARRTLEYILEFKAIETLELKTKQIVQDYNEDDCLATQALHHWLEMIRKEQLEKGADLKRPELNDGNAKEELTQHEATLYAIKEELIRNINDDPRARTEEEKARWLLAHLVHYFDREKKNEWWEFFRVHKMEPDDLYDEKSAIAGLTFVEELPKSGRQRNPRYKYKFPAQEISMDAGMEIHEVDGDKIGQLEAISLEERTLIISQQPGSKPQAIHAIKMINPKVLEDSLLAVINEFKTNGIAGNSKFKATQDLLLRRSPDLSGIQTGDRLIKDESKVVEEAIQRALSMRETTLAIQGPPGTGKTYTGAKIILALALAGNKIGVTAVSHKVIRNVLDKVYEFALEENASSKISLIHKTSESENCPSWITEISDNQKAIDSIQPGAIVGATSFFWADNRVVEKIDFLFVDEAGQMSLANVIAASRSAKNLILLGDPQQLEQPQKGAHPEGSDVAALTHLMDGKQTIAVDQGIFLGTTYRLHPEIASFTSELFYEKRLTSKPGLENVVVRGNSKFSGSGLFHIPVNHTGRQTNSPEEVDVIAKVVQGFINDKLQWTNRKGEKAAITKADILIVAPYNAQVKALSKVLQGFRIGTVDKFQGQEAAIVIYSVTCSSAQDAPRGMEFLYNPNRLNVATSRAQSVCILVGTDKIFEADCRTIEQMRWANAFCRFKELAKVVAIE